MPTDENPPGARRFVEPSEGTFTITVPDGWRVQAGLARQGSEPGSWYFVQSPGGGAELRAIAPRMPGSFLDAPSAGCGSWGWSPAWLRRQENLDDLGGDPSRRR